jgi:probable HAF family extracellular repeat protein
MHKTIGRWALAALCALATTAFAAKAPQWTITDLGGLSQTFGGGSFAQGVNDRGEVTGWSYAGDSVPFHHGFLWSNGEIADLGLPQGNFASGMTALNNHGVVVGTTSGPPHGADMVAIYQDGQWTVPGLEGSAYAVNDHGVVAGQYNVGDGAHAFMLKEGLLFDLGTLGGPYSIAWGINDKSVIVGSSSVANGSTHGFVWDGALHDIGTLGGANSSLFAINSHGTAAGYAQAGGNAVAIVYENGSMRPLTVPGSTFSVARGINDKGAVVGQSDAGGFLYDDGKLTILNTLPEVIAAGWQFLAPYGINNRGWIVGTGSVNGTCCRSFVLVPK